MSINETNIYPVAQAKSLSHPSCLSFPHISYSIDDINYVSRLNPSPTLLLGMVIDIVIMENSMDIPLKIKNKATI